MKLINKILKIAFIILCIYGMALPFFMILFTSLGLPIYFYWDGEYYEFTWKTMLVNLTALIMLFVYYLKKK